MSAFSSVLTPARSCLAARFAPDIASASAACAASFLGPLGAGQEGKGGNHRQGAVILAGPVDDFSIRCAGVYFQVPFDHAVRPDMLGQVERLIVERAPDVEFINHGDARLLGIGRSVRNTRFHRRSWGARDESDLSRGSGRRQRPSTPNVDSTRYAIPLQELTLPRKFQPARAA